MKKSIGVIDLGSNTARLVIYEQDDSGMVTEVDNIKYSLRLSNHLHAGRLDEEGIAKRLTATLMADGTYVRVQPRSPSPFNSQLFFWEEACQSSQPAHSLQQRLKPITALLEAASPL